MAKFCYWTGMICILAAFFVAVSTDFLTGLLVACNAFIFFVLATHLENQKVLIEAVKSTSCPQLYYFRKFAPNLVESAVVEDSPDLKDWDIRISLPKFTSDGCFRVRGAVSTRKIFYRFASFVVEFTPGEKYQTPQDWKLSRFEWL